MGRLIEADCIGERPCKGDNAVRPWYGLLDGDDPLRLALGAARLREGEISILYRLLRICLGVAAATRLGSGWWICVCVLRLLLDGENRDGDRLRLAQG